MIGIHSATVAGAAISLPVIAGVAAPPAAVPAADQAFDEVFRQLVGGLLTTSAEAGEATSEREGEIVAGADAATTDDVSATLPMIVPMMFTAPIAEPAVADEGGAAGDAIAAGTGSSVTAGVESPSASSAATSTPTALAGSAVNTAAARQAVAKAATAASSSAATAGARDAAESADLARDAASTGAGAAAAPTTTTNTDTARPAVGTAAKPTPVDDAPASLAEAIVEGLPTNESPAATAGTETPATEVEAHVRGLERRRGMRETPARARTFDDGSPAVPVDSRVSSGTAVEPTPTLSGPVPSSLPSPGATPREMPMHVERALALQRALARQMDGETPATAAPGPVSQAASSGAAIDTGAGAEQGHEPNDSGRRPGRAWTGTLPAGAPAASAAATLAAAVSTGGAPDPAATPGPAAGAAWRAAVASSAVAEALFPTADTTPTPGLPGAVVSMLQAFEVPMLRDRAPMAVDLPTEIPGLDGPTAEAVHTQIVRSIRMQWTGAASSEARVTLRPEYLGEVVATIKVDQGVVTATLQADTPEVRRWMESHTATLRDALVEHGLKLDRLTVSEPEKQSAQGERQAKSRQQQPPPRQRARRQTSDQDTPFEVTTE